MSAIAAYRTAILALLSDPSKVIFSDTDCDVALRWALTEFSVRRPLIRTYLFDVLTSTVMHTLPADFVTRHITKVELWNATPEQITEIPYYAYFPDEQWVINTKYLVAAGETLQVSYSDVHTVDGLDAAAGTTVPDADEALLQLGAAGQAALMRALNRVETINMNSDVIKSYRALAADYLARFAGILSIEPGTSNYVPEFPGDHPSKLVL